MAINRLKYPITFDEAIARCACLSAAAYAKGYCGLAGKP